MLIACIHSGGQTGADRAGLDAAIEAGVPHGGYCPCGRKAEDGVISDRYSLKETGSSGYTQRTKMNVLVSDATVVFTQGKVGPGSAQTLRLAAEFGKPSLHVDVSVQDTDKAVGMVLEWLRSLSLDHITLNVAGSRESSSPGIGSQVYAVILKVLKS